MDTRFTRDDYLTKNFWSTKCSNVNKSVKVKTCLMQSEMNVLLIAMCLWVTAQLTSWSLILFGTATPPVYLASTFPQAARTHETAGSQLPRTLPLTPVLLPLSFNHTAQHNNVSIAATTSRSSTYSATELMSADTGGYIVQYYHNITFIRFGRQVGWITTNIQTYTGWINR